MPGRREGGEPLLGRFVAEQGLSATGHAGFRSGTPPAFPCGELGTCPMPSPDASKPETFLAAAVLGRGPATSDDGYRADVGPAEEKSAVVRQPVRRRTASETSGPW